MKRIFCALLLSGVSAWSHAAPAKPEPPLLKTIQADPPACVFCVRPEPQSLAYEDAELYVKPTYGMMDVPGYVLLIPRRHVASYGDLSLKEQAAFVKERTRLVSAVAAAFAAPVIFEHGVTGQTIRHAHLHVVPGLDFKAFVAKTEMLLGNESPGAFTRKDISPQEELAEKARARASAGGYLYLCEPASGKAVLFTVKPDPAHSMILRRAAAAVFGRPQLADWKAVQSVPEFRRKDEALRQETIDRLKPLLAR